MNASQPNDDSAKDDDKTDLGTSIIEQFQQDLFLAKCEIKIAVRDVAINVNLLYDLFLKLRADYNEINERLHGIELRQQR